MDNDLSRVRAMVQALAERAIAMAADGATTRPRAGERRYCLVEMMPAASCLLGQGGLDWGVPPVDGSASITDGSGHRRPVYRYLAAYLHARTGAAAQTLGLNRAEESDVSLRLWAAVTAAQAGDLDTATVDRWLDTGHDSLQPSDPNEAADHWTYRELTGLHALQALVELTGNARWAARVAEVARFHQANTQPDYTTYQPWGLAAFLATPQTVPFAEQQLHDVETHLSLAGGPGAVVPAILLADAYASLDALD